ncbi:MAG TPA: CBS domain-containing protein [Pseudonocardiaceae bacterium]|nr:CBS domain-containing protein [Pseudonocardiaceae bacterium]
MLTTTVSDVMTSDVVTVDSTTPFKDIIDLMVREGISALPVVDRAGNLLGIVSEVDLLCKEQHADDEPDAGPPRFAGHQARDQWRKAAALTAADVMTSPVLSVRSDTGLPEVARHLAATGVRRLCVVDEGKLVGIVARRDLLRPFLRADDEILAQVDDEVLGRALHANPAMVRATVVSSVVMLTGRVEYQGDVSTAVRLVRAIPGVVAVKNRLDWQWNGPRPHIDEPAPTTA